MACSTREKYGYEDELFEKDVDDEFHCPICHNVLKDPKMCQDNEHIFCHNCITEHLRVNSATCPQCKDRLTVETLRRAPRVVMNYLSKLKIKCDYYSRGCQEFIPLEELPSHVENCSFAPVKCSNQECQMVINKREKIHHETSVCEYRKAQCHSCELILVEVIEMKREIEAVNGKVEAAVVQVVKDHFDAKVEALKENVEAVKENQAELKHDFAKLSAIMNEVLGKLRSLELGNQGASSVTEATNVVLKDILVAGGWVGERSLEKFSWKENTWVEVMSMNTRRAHASLFVYLDQVFVVGGWGHDAQGTMEIMKAENEILKWKKFLGSLPYPCFAHQTVVYQHRMILIGGYNDSISSLTSSIYELRPTPPYSHKLLSELPEPRMFHRAEIFDDKVLILGGNTSHSADALDSVLEFDVNTSACKVMPSLPRGVSRMATVRWKDKVVVMGGQDKKGKVLNDVFTYDCKAGKIDVLPSMLEKRWGCCSVITGNTIVVIGGKDQHGKELNSVESLSLGDKTWKHLPALHQARLCAIAEVLS